MAARLVLLLLAVPCLALGVSGLHADHRCRVELGAVPQLHVSDQYGAHHAERQLAQWCTHDTDKAAGIIALGAAGHVPEAMRLARQLAADAPHDYLGWLALSRLEAGSDPAASRRDYAHAQRLNPRGLQGPAPSAPRPGGPGPALRTGA